MSFNLSGLLFGNIDSDGEVDDEMAEVSQAMRLIGTNMNEQLGFNMDDVKQKSGDTEAIIPDENAVDYDDIDEVIDEEEEEEGEDEEETSTTNQPNVKSENFYNMGTTGEDEEDYDAEDENTENIIEKKKERPEPESNNLIQPMAEINMDYVSTNKNKSFRVKRERKSARPKQRRPLQSRVSNFKNIKFVYLILM